jgi:SnoaL-like domain
MERSAELRMAVERFYECFVSGDAALVERYVDNIDGLLVIGTDPREWWNDYESVMTALKAQAGELSGVGLKIRRDQDVRALQEGSVGWIADRPIFVLPDGSEVEMRVTAVFLEQVDGWKLAQWHASFGVANEDAIGRGLTV